MFRLLFCLLLSLAPTFSESRLLETQVSLPHSNWLLRHVVTGSIDSQMLHPHSHTSEVLEATLSEHGTRPAWDTTTGQRLHRRFFPRTPFPAMPHLSAPNPKGPKLQNFTEAEIKSSLSRSKPVHLPSPFTCNTHVSPQPREPTLHIGLLPPL